MKNFIFYVRKKNLKNPTLKKYIGKRVDFLYVEI